MLNHDTDFDDTEFELCDPGETVVMTAPPAAHLEYDPTDLRIIPVEIETTFAFAENGDLQAEDTNSEVRPEAVLLDAGDLGVFDETLAGLGVDSERIHVENLEALGDWTRPSRLLVVSSRLALELPIGPEAKAQDFSALAVSDEASKGFAHHMRKRGFQYVVNQPIHQEVLRLLLQQALFHGNQQRKALRYPVGRQVAWRRGRNRQHATLVELSSIGGHLHSARLAAVDTPITLRVRGTGEARPLTLNGHVVRCERCPGEDRRFSLGVAWNLPTDAERQTLNQLLGSPSQKRRAEVAAAVAAALVAPAPETPRNAPPRRAPSTRPPRRPSELHLPNRRRDDRSEFERELVALDTHSRVCSTLVGLDLSTQGIRVQRHEALMAGQSLRIAVHIERGEEPLVLETRVARDDGTRGLLLTFHELCEATSGQIAYLLARLPKVEATRCRPRRKTQTATWAGAPPTPSRALLSASMSEASHRPWRGSIPHRSPVG